MQYAEIPGNSRREFYDGKFPNGNSRWPWQGRRSWGWTVLAASFTSSGMKDLCQKWKVKLIFRGANRLSGTGMWSQKP